MVHRDLFEEHGGAWRNSLEQAEDEGVEPHAMAGEFRVLADLGEQRVEQPCRRAWQDKKCLSDTWASLASCSRMPTCRLRTMGFEP